MIFLVIREMLVPPGNIPPTSFTEAGGGNSVHDEATRRSEDTTSLDSSYRYCTEFFVHRRITALTVEVTKKKLMITVCRSYSAGDSGSVTPKPSILSHTISLAL